MNVVKINQSQQDVLDAASQLFFRNGFHGTSVRDIAERANVNVSLISYYFKSKQGLLEYAVTYYYEAYLENLETVFQQTKDFSPVERLKAYVAEIIKYKQEHYQLSCYINRELSLDSVFVREMAVTYLAKENYYLKTTFIASIEQQKGPQDRDFLYMHFKGMLITPYVLHNEWKDQVVGKRSHDSFQKKYVETVHSWLDYLTDETAIKYNKSSNVN